MSTSDTEPLLRRETEITTYRLPEREGMLEEEWREEQARWDKETLEAAHGIIRKLLQEIVDQEKDLRQGSQQDVTVLAAWKDEVMRLMDNTPGYHLFNYHWAEGLKKHLYSMERALRTTTTHPVISRRNGKVRPGYTAEELVKSLGLQSVGEYRIHQIWARLDSIGSRLSNGGSHIKRNPVHPDFGPLWSRPILYAIRHTKGFSVLKDDCYFQVMAVLSQMETKSCKGMDQEVLHGKSHEDNFQTAFLKKWPAEKVLELIGLDRLELPPPDITRSERLRKQVKGIFQRGPSPSMNASLSHRSRLNLRQLGIYGFESQGRALNEGNHF
ncbi:hypothetical protein JCM3765_002525 [Sporobolomyces pararoseus]